MSNSSTTLAVIFDFDDTLVPDSTTKLLKEHGIDTQQFWRQQVRRMVRQGFDPTLAFLALLLDKVGVGKPLGKLTNRRLREFGAKLDSEFYPGLPGLFPALRGIAKTYRCNVEFYVVSGGLQEIIEGSKIVRENFSGVYGCQLGEDQTTGMLRYIKRCVTFTEKTRYLFEINKGLDPLKTQRNPFLVNKDVPLHKRAIPFKNMIYVGDGLTDIPCFSLLKKEGGVSFGVFNPAARRSAKRAFIEFLRPARVISMNAARYRLRDELGSLLRVAVATRCSKIKLERREAES